VIGTRLGASDGKLDDGGGDLPAGSSVGCSEGKKLGCLVLRAKTGLLESSKGLLEGSVDTSPKIPSD
jgi:hypothetical protein